MEFATVGRRICAFVCCLVVIAPVWSQAPREQIQKQVADLQKKVDDETGRMATKKNAVALEYDALKQPTTAKKLAALVAPVIDHFRLPLTEAAKAPTTAAAVLTAKEFNTACAETVAQTVGRNLAPLLSAAFADSLADAIKSTRPPDVGKLFNAAVKDEFENKPFETLWTEKLLATFEKPLTEAKTALEQAKLALAQIESNAESGASGTPPGMVRVPAGKHHIGTTNESLAKLQKSIGYEKPPLPTIFVGWPEHTVDLPEFYIDRNEVTNRDWAAYLADTGRPAPTHWILAARTTAGVAASPLPPTGGAAGSTHVPTPGTEDCPVTLISYEDMLAYCRWCGRRLPTEFEWEAAARANNPGETLSRYWPWCDLFDLRTTLCNDSAAALLPIRAKNAGSLPGLTPVGFFGAKGASALGINDMAGNAIEMTSSAFVPYPGWDAKKAPPGAPHNGSFDPLQVVVRGGHYENGEIFVTTFVRRGMDSGAKDKRAGFRTAASKDRSRDFAESVLADRNLAVALADLGAANKDEMKTGKFPQLAPRDPSRVAAVMAGGWDYEKNLPARARQIAVALRNTSEFTRAGHIKELCVGQKASAMMLGLFHTDVDFRNPGIKAGSYWVMWEPEGTKQVGKEKAVVGDGLVFRPRSGSGEPVRVTNMDARPIMKSTERTQVNPNKNGGYVDLVLSFPSAESPSGRFIISLRLEAANPEQIKDMR